MLRERKPLATTDSSFACLVLLLLGIVANVGCHSSDANVDRIDVLRIGVLPGEDPASLQQQFSPLIEYLQQQLGRPCQLLQIDSYEQLQSAFEDDELDLAWFGGYTFINVNRSHGAVALVSRDRDLRFTSYFFVRPDETASELSDYGGKRFAFGSRLSTSGHLMPRHFLRQWEIIPEKFFGEVQYTGAHDKTVIAVRDGTADIGVASGPAIEAMIESGRLKDDSLHILKETPPYLDYVWACRSQLPAALRTQIRDAFLSLTTNNPAHAEILNRLRAEYFVPAHIDDFRELQRIIDSSALSEITK